MWPYVLFKSHRAGLVPTEDALYIMWVNLHALKCTSFISLVSLSRLIMLSFFVWKDEQQKPDATHQMRRHFKNFHPTGSPRLYCAGTNYGNPLNEKGCACVHEKKLHRWQWEIRSYFDPCDWRHNGEFAFERDSFSFQKKEMPGSSTYQATCIPVWSRKAAFQIWDCT